MIVGRDPESLSRFSFIDRKENIKERKDFLRNTGLERSKAELT